MSDLTFDPVTTCSYWPCYDCQPQWFVSLCHNVSVVGVFSTVNFSFDPARLPPEQPISSAAIIWQTTK